MIINHNMGALNSNRQIGINQANANKSMEKLSSGLKINRAGDDAAGLAISEKMRAQIRGLDQAAANAQDGISMIQTAEGALNETHSILQRMRELAVQSSNDTNNDNDRSEIQKEVDQLTAEITRIGDNTEFNTKTLLNGGAGITATINNTSVIKGVSGTADTKAAAKIELTIGGVTSLAKAAETEITLSNNDTIETGGKITINGVSLDVADGTKGEDLAKLINENSSKFGVTANYDDGTDKLTFTKIGVTGSSSELEVKFSTGFKSDGTTQNTSVSEKGANAVIVAGADFKIDGNNSSAGDFVVNGNKVTIIKEGDSKGLTFELTEAGKAVTLEVESNNSLKFAIGANKAQQMDLSINDMRAEALGVDGIKVNDRESANSSIEIIQSAIDMVSSERSKLGAYQNRLEHTISNLGTSSENLTSAESRIRDVNMAKEMSTFSKNNILSQAAQAMLAQANQQPQQVLQLLR